MASMSVVNGQMGGAGKTAQPCANAAGYEVCPEAKSGWTRRYSACEGPTYCRSTYFKRRSKGLGSAPYVEVRDTRLPHACAERGDIPKAPRKLPNCSKCVVLGHRKNV